MVDSDTTQPRKIHSLFGALALSVLIVYVVVNSALNISLDPYGVFKKPQVASSKYTNERFLKVDHLLSGNPYDLLILGSSRVGNLDPALLQYDGRAYNASFLTAKISEYRDLVKTLDRYKKLPKEMVIAVDVDQFEAHWNITSLTSPAYSMHPEVSGAGLTNFYLKALLRDRIWSVITGKHGAQEQVIYDFTKGYFSPSETAFSVVKGIPQASPYKGWDSRALNAFEETLVHLTAAGVKVTVVINPLPPMLHEKLVPHIEELKVALVSSGAKRLLDYSMHEATRDPTYMRFDGDGSSKPLHWYDPQHYRDYVTREVIQGAISS